MSAKIVNCEHVEKYGHRIAKASFLIGDNTRLLVCETCMGVIKSVVMTDLAKEVVSYAVKQNYLLLKGKL